MFFFVDVEYRDDSLERLVKVVVTRHVGGHDTPDHPFAEPLELFRRQITKQVASGLLEDFERSGTVVVLQWRDVVIPATGRQVDELQTRSAVHLVLISFNFGSIMINRRQYKNFRQRKI